MVTIQHRIKRLPPSTIDGETLILETIYTSYDKTEIDWIEKQSHSNAFPTHNYALERH